MILDTRAAHTVSPSTTSNRDTTANTVGLNRRKKIIEHFYRTVRNHHSQLQQPNVRPFDPEILQRCLHDLCLDSPVSRRYCSRLVTLLYLPVSYIMSKIKTFSTYSVHYSLLQRSPTSGIVQANKFVPAVAIVCSSLRLHWSYFALFLSSDTSTDRIETTTREY